MPEDIPQQLPPQFREQPVTARLLDDFALCPRKFLLSFFTTREQEHRFRGGPAALHQAVRQALVEWYNLGGPGQATLQNLLDAFESNWQGNLCTDSLEEEQLHEAGLLMLTEYYVDHEHDRVPIIGTDLRITGNIGDQAFVATADVVLGSEECRDLYRFATSRHPLTGGELAKDVSAQVLWLLAHDTYAGESDVRIWYYALRSRRGYQADLDDDTAAHVRHELASRVARILRERDFEPQKGKHCRWCRSRSRCPAWQR